MLGKKVASTILEYKSLFAIWPQSIWFSWGSWVTRLEMADVPPGVTLLSKQMASSFLDSSCCHENYSPGRNGLLDLATPENGAEQGWPATQMKQGQQAVLFVIMEVLAHVELKFISRTTALFLSSFLFLQQCFLPHLSLFLPGRNQNMSGSFMILVTLFLPDILFSHGLLAMFLPLFQRGLT